MSQTLKYLKLSPSERLTAMRKQAEENLEKCRTHIGLVNTKITEISEKKQKILTEISTSFNILKEALEERQNILEKEIIDKADEEIEKFEEIKEEAQELYDASNIALEHLMGSNECDLDKEDLKPITQLSELPTVEIN
eukprot:CAMPEP_0202948148 /NCGR_PEP_ID=MMETSP1395-20130829/13089_1 /ASSEMBLY_ACC=CAM_ASM_000871 /TAXON_ID=5961 /ORGANISM="Blepharisma japonicum, Strain Stock R1072" /LENGTH=137 /DNA_ID=CAMNT_0049649969 /DNA_START=222 /DNA_END=635 /DNA_ORIENTATION=-